MATATYVTLVPVTYIDEGHVREVTKAGVQIQLDDVQAAALAGSVSYVSGGIRLQDLPRLAILGYDSLSVFPITGSGSYLYLDESTGLLYSWNDGTLGYAAVSQDGSLLSANNLSDIASASTARANLGIPFKVVAASGDITGASDSAAITAAIGSGTVRVVLGAGDFFVNASIVLQNHTWLDGVGLYATRIHLANGVNASVIKNFVSPDGIVANAMHCRVSNLFIDGNKSHQSAGHGIEYVSYPLTSTASGDDLGDYDTHQAVDNVRIQYCKQDGFNMIGRSSSIISNVYAADCDRNGFRTGSDTTYSNCVSGHSGYEGFYMQFPSAQLVGCKSFYSGQVSPTNGDGFLVTSTNGMVLAGCYAQDNCANGFGLTAAASTVLAGCVADSNSTNIAGAYVGVDVYASQGCEIQVACYERKADGVHSYQPNALQVRSSSVGNSIYVTHQAAGGATIGSAIRAGSTLTGNSIVVNGQTVQDSGSVLTDPKINAIYDASTGTPVATFVGPASAVNYLQFISAATGGVPALTMQGSDTNIPWLVSPKGSGGVLIYGNTGQTVQGLGARGSATNVDLNLTTQGTGVVKANNVPVVTTTDAQTLTTKTLTSPKVNAILDANGVKIIELATTASAANWVELHNNVAGGRPYFFAAGADTNIGISLIPKGTGDVQIFQLSGNAATVTAEGVASDIDLNVVTKGVGRLKENGNIASTWVAVPATATSTGKVGQQAADSSWLYICTAANTWRRVAIAAW